MAERMPPQEPKESDARDDSAEQHPPTRPAPTESEIDHEDPVPQGESVQTPGALQPGTGARKGKRVAANVDGAMQGHDMYAIGSFPPGSSYPPGAHALRPAMAFPHGGQTKKHKKLMMQQQQQFQQWAQQHQEYAARIQAWQQQQQQNHTVQPSAAKWISPAFLSKASKAKQHFNHSVMKEANSSILQAGHDGVSPYAGNGADRSCCTYSSKNADEEQRQPAPKSPSALMHSAGEGALPPAAVTARGDDYMAGTRGQAAAMHDQKRAKLWCRLQEAYDDPEKLEAVTLEILTDQPSILAKAVHSESGQSVQHATVMRAVCEARPTLNLLVGILSKYVPVEAWNKEVRPMCEQLQTIFGKPGLFCGHAQGAKELKAAEAMRNPTESATQRKGRDGRTPTSEGEGVVSMYGKRLLQGCRCDSSKCLKMYCTCFRNETRCTDACVCQSCYNDGQHEEERLAALRASASTVKRPRHEEGKLQTQAALLAAVQEPKKSDSVARKKRGRAYTKAQIKIAAKLVLEYEKKCEDLRNRSILPHGGMSMHHHSMPGSSSAGQPLTDLGRGGTWWHGNVDGHKSRDIPRTGTFENEAVWATFCSQTGEVNHRAVNLWDRVQRDMRKKPEQNKAHASRAQTCVHVQELDGTGHVPDPLPPGAIPPPPPSPRTSLNALTEGAAGASSRVGGGGSVSASEVDHGSEAGAASRQQ